jgi:hypothetical protein
VRSYYGKGDVPAPGPTPARTIFQNYKGEVREGGETVTLEWTGPGGEGGCASVRAHTDTSDARARLKAGFVGDYPHLSQREITKEELAGATAEELELMRNEIYAAYGHAFKKPRFRDHFAKNKRYSPRFTDVSAFLSPIETKNVATIRAVEKAR